MNETYRILLADEEGISRNSAAEILRQLGYSVDIANDATEAIEKISANRYDVLISDIALSGNKNMEFVLKANSIDCGIPIILMADHSTIDTAVIATKLSIAGYLAKPLDFDELIRVVKQCIAWKITYHTITEKRKRLNDWCNELDDIEKLFRAPIVAYRTESARSLHTACFKIAIGSLADFYRMTDALTTADRAASSGKTADLQNKLSITRNALIATIQELEESKHAFKSKRLGTLRKQLKAVLSVLDQDTMPD